MGCQARGVHGASVQYIADSSFGHCPQKACLLLSSPAPGSPRSNPLERAHASSNSTRLNAFLPSTITLMRPILRLGAALPVLTAFTSGVSAVSKITRAGRYLYDESGNRFYIKGVAYQEQGE